MNEPTGNPFLVLGQLLHSKLHFEIRKGTCICCLKHSNKQLGPYKSIRNLTCALEPNLEVKQFNIHLGKYKGGDKL